MHPSSDGSTAAAEITVVLPAHLHARPAGRLAQTAAAFEATVQLDYAGRTADPRGILAVMALGATKGERLTIRASGPDAHPALKALAQVLEEAE